jgi:hypothetical protein
MSAYEDVTAALVQKLYAIDNLPDVAWPNTDYTPTTGELYLAAHLLPAETTAAGIGKDAKNKAPGIWQVDVKVPLGSGRSEYLGWVDTICNQFKRGNSSTYNGITVWFRKAYPGPRIIEGAWCKVPVTIRFYAYIAN